MPSCVASGCAARSNKGDVFKVFPRKDLKRRHLWIERVNRPGWCPTKYSALCERHFDYEQWEVPREDGKRKLKNTALPTIFCVEHPPDEDLVAKDHSYCILGYRQLYEVSDGAAKKDNASITNFEHIKVEMDENETFPRDVPEEEAENIQCTPDISFYPEPDPIEMVHCEENDINANQIEPGIDPLAISLEDMKQTESEVPHFRHAKKFVFVAKDTKYVMPSFPSEVTGEPVVENKLPKLKVLSPEQLFNLPSVSQSGPLSNSLVPDAQPASALDSTGLPLPVKVHLIPLKSKSDSTNPKFDSQTRYQSKNTSSSFKVDTSARGHSIPTKEIQVERSGSKPPPLAISPELLNPSRIIRVLPNHTNRLIKLGNLSPSSKSQVLLLNKSLKRKFKINSRVESGSLKEFGRNVYVHQSKPISNSMEVCEQLEKVFLDHEYLKKPMWRPVSMDGMKLVKDSSSPTSSTGVFRLIGNNDVKMWISKKNAADGCLRTCSKFKVVDSGSPRAVVKKFDSVCISGSSVVVLNPFEKSRPTGVPSMKLISPANRQSVNLFLCAVCQSSFLTAATLRLHLNSHLASKSVVGSACSADREDATRCDEDIKEKRRQEVDVKRVEEIVTCPTSSEQKPIVNNNNIDGSNRSNDDDDDDDDGGAKAKLLIPNNVTLKKLIVSLPKLNIESECKPVKQNVEVTTCPLKNGTFKKTNRTILRKKYSCKRYFLRSKTEPVQSKLSDRKCKEKYKPKKDTSNKMNNKLRDKLIKKSRMSEKTKLTSSGVFVTKHELTEHTLDSSLKYNCEFCDKRFSKELKLQRHTAKDHRVKKGKPYGCPWKLCNAKFTSKRLSANHSKICFPQSSLTYSH